MKLRKKQKTIVVAIAVTALTVATIPGAIWVTHTQSAELGNGRARCDKNPGITRNVSIANGHVSPAHTDAKKCDILVITNEDKQPRLMAFGQHENHISYDGISEKLLNQGQNLRVVLLRNGTYLFHDHQDDTVRGTFTVK